jgi:cell division protein FtsL
MLCVAISPIRWPTAERTLIWKNIAVQINSLGLHYRTDKEVKTKWQNMQTSAKKQYVETNKTWTVFHHVDNLFCFIAQFFGWRSTASLSGIFLLVCILLFCTSLILNKFNRRCLYYYRYLQYFKKDQLIFVCTDVTNSDLYFVKQMLGAQKVKYSNAYFYTLLWNIR